MRKTHIGAALLAAIIIAASCNETKSPVAPTPVPEPRPPVALRTLEIMGVPEAGLPAGEVVQLTAQIRLPDGGTEAVFRPTWTSSNPDIAMVEIRGILVGLSVGRTEITASHQELDAKAHAEITPAQPNETLWRELAFNYLQCPPTEPACGTPLETRTLRRLPVTSPNFAIVSHTLRRLAKITWRLLEIGAILESREKCSHTGDTGEVRRAGCIAQREDTTALGCGGGTGWRSVPSWTPTITRRASR